MNWLPLGANSFLFRVIPFSEGRRTILTELLPLKCNHSPLATTGETAHCVVYDIWSPRSVACVFMRSERYFLIIDIFYVVQQLCKRVLKPVIRLQIRMWSGICLLSYNVMLLHVFSCCVSIYLVCEKTMVWPGLYWFCVSQVVFYGPRLVKKCLRTHAKYCRFQSSCACAM